MNNPTQALNEGALTPGDWELCSAYIFFVNLDNAGNTSKVDAH